MSNASDDTASHPAQPLKQQLPQKKAAIARDVQTLLGMISHELRTPIQTILANAEVMGLTQLPPDAELALQRVMRSIDVALRRLDSITQFVRTSTDDREATRRPFDLLALLRTVADDCEPEAAMNGQHVIVHSAACPPELDGDPDRLHQVLTNYVLNAVRHGQAGSPIDIEVRPARMAGSDRPALEIRVINAGSGVPASQQMAVWEPFVRSESGPNRVKGMGLGLAVVRLVSDAAEWEVGGTSGEGKTTFWVRLPVPAKTD